MRVQGDFGRVFALAAALALLLPGAALAQISTTDLDSGETPQSLVDSLLGGGITAFNVTYSGSNLSAGTFSDAGGVVGFNNGIILSSGFVGDAAGPNSSDGITGVIGTPGDADLDSLIPGFTTLDAVILEFDFIPDSGFLLFNYVFGSDEYNEYTNSDFNDVFGFFVNGVNQALLPDGVTPVSINNVNGGNSFECDNFLDDDADGPVDGDDSDCSTPLDNIVGELNANSGFFINNDCGDPDGGAPCPLNIEADGYTVVLTLFAAVNPGETNHIKLAIADAGDDALDSWVFIEAESVTTVDEICNGIDDDENGQIDDGLGQTTCGIGACEETVENCLEGQVQVCVPGDPTDENCENGIDDDCDGLTDGADVEDCEPGQDEICNGIDDDNNGQIDDGLGQTTCGIGACEETVENCLDGQLQVCVPGDPTDENCSNGIDDDCDGLTDGADDDCEPLLAVIESFTATPQRGGVRIEWTTSSEIDNVGFRLLRGRYTNAGGERGIPVLALAAVVDQVIPAQGTALSGADYEYLDTAPQKRGAVLYYLEDIDTTGRVTRHGPVEVKVSRHIVGKKKR